MRDMSFDEYRIANRHLSESEVRNNYAKRTGQSEHDVDDRLFWENERRKEHFERIDAGGLYR